MFIYIVLTEDFYGGGVNVVRKFNALEDAQEYAESLGDDKDTIIIKFETSDTVTISKGEQIN